MYLPQTTWLQRAKGLAAVTWGGMAQAPGDPGFVGPLTPDEQTIANLQAGIQYRDVLLGQQPGFNLSTFIQQNQGPLLIFGAVVFGLAAMRR